MGGFVRERQYDDRDYLRFSARLREQLTALGDWLAKGGGNEPGHSLGAELELYLVDEQGFPLHKNQELLTNAADPNWQLELNRFNLEYNLDPTSLSGRPFTHLGTQANDALAHINHHAAKFGGAVVATGILPTLRPSDCQHCITPLARYHQLTDNLRQIRGGPFQIAIENPPHQLSLACDDVALEGANTSWQFHLRLPANEFADWYNAIQLVTPVVLGLSCNSPLLFNTPLWEETRVALFRQSIDCRNGEQDGWRQPARVNYGDGWVRHGIWELFAAAVALYPPLLPDCSDPPRPDWPELRLHMGTVWSWNRPVLDGDHVRIEMRSLPAGPSVIDMLASSTLMVGAAAALRHRMHHLTAALPFRYCERNFLAAARDGLAANLIWPDEEQLQLSEKPLIDIAQALLSPAEMALTELGVNRDEVTTQLDVIRARMEKRQNGALWQRRAWEKLGADLRAAREVVKHYQYYQRSNRPVHEWELPT